MNAFDRAMNLLDEKFSILASTKQIVSSTNEDDKVYKNSERYKFILPLILVEVIFC